MFGYTCEEAVGRHITLIIPTDRREEETGIMARLRRAEHIDHFETVRQRKDGSLLDVSLSISPVKGLQRRRDWRFESRARYHRTKERRTIIARK